MLCGELHIMKFVLFICSGPPFLIGHLISYSIFCLNVSNSPYMMHLHIPIIINDTCWPNPNLDFFSAQ